MDPLCIHRALPSFYLLFLPEITKRQSYGLFSHRQHMRTLAIADYSPTIWKRYVDGTFVILSHGREKLEIFLSHINSLHHNISFTMEIEENKKIAFLDVQICRNDDNTSMYCKPTHTN